MKTGPKLEVTGVNDRPPRIISSEAISGYREGQSRCCFAVVTTRICAVEKFAHFIKQFLRSPFVCIHACTCICTCSVSEVLTNIPASLESALGYSMCDF